MNEIRNYQIVRLQQLRKNSKLIVVLVKTAWRLTMSSLSPDVCSLATFQGIYDSGRDKCVKHFVHFLR